MTDPCARLLALLDGDALGDVADALGLEVPDDATEPALREYLAADEATSLRAVLAALPRETLKSVCKALTLPTDGRGKAVLVRRVIDALGQHDEAPSRTLQVEVFPRQPRLAWSGMDQREAVTAVPAQVVEVVRPARAIDRTSGPAPELPNVDVATAARAAESAPNRLVWTNDNLVALQTLLDERDPRTREYLYRGKVDLVYIDPPFMVGSDFRGDNTIDIPIDEDADISAKKEPSLVEFLAYRDTWRNGLDSFLAMLRRRLELLKALLSPTGSIYVHLDWHAVHYVKVLMDEVFGYENFVNEVVWKRTTSHADAKGFNAIHDTILIYSPCKTPYWNPVFAPHSADYIKSHYNKTDEQTGRRYRLNDLRSPAPRPNMMYDWKGYKPHKNGWSISKEVMADYDKRGLIYYPPNGERLAFKKFLDDDGIAIPSWWADIPPVNSQAEQRLGYPTQKPLALLERIISASCPPGGLVLDCFMGSGTTVEAAERLGRRWIGIDCGKYAVHLARKRLILLHGTARPPEKAAYDYVECDRCKTIERKPKKQRSPGLFSVRPFTVENMGVYQRAEHWQDFQRERTRYRDEMVRVFGGEPTESSPLLHGKKDRTWIHVGPLDGPVTIEQVYAIARAAAATELHSVSVLCAEYDAISSQKTQVKADTGVTIDVRTIPKQAIDEVKRRIEAQRNGGATIIESMAVPVFYAPLSIYLSARSDGRMVTVKLERCEVDHESFLASQRPVLKPIDRATTPAQKKRAQAEHAKWEDRRKALIAWLDKAQSWQHFVDFWAVDWQYGERPGVDGKPVFETAWQSFRTRDGKGEAGGLTFEAKYQYDRPGTYRVAARVTDVFGNDGIATVQVVVK